MQVDFNCLETQSVGQLELEIPGVVKFLLVESQNPMEGESLSR
jgi:hypothetical protein